MSTLVSLFLFSNAAYAGCDLKTGLEALHLDLAHAEEAYAVGDTVSLSQFTAIIAGIREQLPCLGELMVPLDASRLHRVLGLDAWLRRSEGGMAARSYFAAARYVEPHYVFPEEVMGKDDLEYREYIAVIVESPALQHLPTSEGLQPYVNGDPNSYVPSNWPAVVQWVDNKDDVVCTEYLNPGTESQCVGKVKKEGPKVVPLSIMAGSLAMTAGGIGWEAFVLNRREALDLDACEDDGDCPYKPDEAAQLLQVAKLQQMGAVMLMTIGGVGVLGGGVSLLIDQQGMMMHVQGAW